MQDPDMAKRISRLTLETTGSANSNNEPSTQHIRHSFLGADLQRPDSGFSSQSDQRGRTLSPRLSPQRPSSRQSRSPDSRPLSYVDLLNVPYPQPGPSGTENLVNQGLRNVVGQNASLLSTRKTLDMYRMNVKKTNDPAVQYDFAIFMISAAQEEGLEQDDESVSGTSQKSANPPVRSDLLKEAKHILQKLSDRSYPFAQYYLADGYASGLFNNGKPDLERSFPLFLAASKHGHAEAMYRTALCHEYGWGCRVDAAKAVQFYQHAASKNHPGAMLRLGRACLTGEMGLTKRYREGIRWLKRGSESADLQYNQAPYDLACLHEEGYGPDVFKDESYAAQLYTKAADLGHKDACFRLGEAYEYGQLNCPKDPSLSIHFYTGAAEQGHPQAQMALCAWYMIGVPDVLEKDEAEAYEWAKKAAENGLPKAQYTVGYFTEMGIGCRRDPLEANVWYVRAADQGEERAKHRISAIRAASSGADPVLAARKAKQMPATTNGDTTAKGETTKVEGEKKKKFGLF
ncbi:Chitin synthase 4 [Lithohypha guttulata]|nr:Chitin synthase 4 [Lithohypha guttulata]KAK5106267.1 Chitin synthase 4 [Lithohypha guttulata]